MKNTEVQILPCRMEDGMNTILVVDGRKIDSRDNRLTNLVVYQPMSKWLNPYKKKLFVWEGLLPELIYEFNDNSIHFIFCGCKADYTMFRKSLLLQQARLNRNGGTVRISFEHKDTWNKDNLQREMLDILDDLRVEADNCGEDDIIGEVDLLINMLTSAEVTLKSGNSSFSNNLADGLSSRGIILNDDAVLKVIFSDSPFEIQDYLRTLSDKNEENRLQLIISSQTGDDPELFDAVLPYSGNPHIKYLENDGEDIAAEIEKLYYLAVLPTANKKAREILGMFPDSDTNSFLLDISDRLNDLFN